MKVALVSEHASPLASLGQADAGGQNVHVEALAKHLAARGCQVIVYTRRDNPDLPRIIKISDLYTVVSIDAGPPTRICKDQLLPYVPVFAEELARQWHEFAPDIVHAHFWMSGLAAMAANDRYRLPIVQTFHALGSVKRRHQLEADTSPPTRGAAESMLIERADHLIATCADEVRELCLLGAERDQISVIPSGVDLRQFRPAGSRPRRTSASYRIVAVSRLVERKGLRDVVRAMAELPEAELLIAGGPRQDDVAADPFGYALTELARSVGVADQVTLVGGLGRAEVAALLRSADVFVSVPWYEPFGISPLEAMACGVPTVVSAVGGMLDTVVPDVTGCHVPARDPDALSKAVNRLLRAPSSRYRMGMAGAERARWLYDWNQVADSHLHVYGGIITGRTRHIARSPGRRSA